MDEHWAAVEGTAHAVQLCQPPGKRKYAELAAFVKLYGRKDNQIRVVPALAQHRPLGRMNRAVKLS